jgi:branched-chain amino acid transport system ATP-binding protein
MLEARNVAVAYDGLQVLWDVSIRVDDGEIVALLGPNGSGKSTLMSSISGVVRPLSGEIRFDGTALHTIPAHRAIRIGVTHVLERHRLFPYMTVLENLQLGAGPGASKQHIAEGLERAYALFPRLQERRRQLARTLSGGEQQMCAIARGMMSRPKLLLIDEPFIGLSPALRRQVADAIRTINRGGVAILLIEQNVAEALRLSHRAYVLRAGRLVLDGRSEELRVGRAVEEVFFGRASASSHPSSSRRPADGG